MSLIDQRPVVLEFVDREMSKRSSTICANSELTFRFGEKVRRLGIDTKRDFVFGRFGERQKGARMTLLSMLWVAKPMGDQLHLEAGGLTPTPVQAESDEFFKLKFHTSMRLETLWFPALASTSMEQGRLAAVICFRFPSSNAGAVSLWDLHHSGDLHGRSDRGNSNVESSSIRGGDRQVL